MFRHRSVPLLNACQPLAPGAANRIVLLLCVILCMSARSLHACPLELPTTTLFINGHALVVELAATPQSRACGLSQRLLLDKNHGMLFVYPQPGMRTFWMKGTHIPLSIAFLNRTLTIIHMAAMDPDQTGERYPSRLPAQYALEVNRGWFDRHGIGIGDRVELKTADVRD